jgi:hypothetical protein
MNTFVNDQTAGEHVASKGRRMKKDTSEPSGPKDSMGDKGHASGMKKAMKDHSHIQPTGKKTASGGACGSGKY